MLSFSKDAVIHSPPEAVFGYVSDIARHPEWAAFKLEVEAQSEASVAPGARYETLGHMMGSKSRDQVTVTDVQSPSRFVFESTSKDGHFRHTFDVEPAGAGTRLRKTWDLLEMSTGMKLWTPFIKVMAPRILSGDVKRIKERVEAASLTPPV